MRNAWIALSTSAHRALKTRMETADDEYTGAVKERAFGIFRRLIGGRRHGLQVQNMFRRATHAGKNWRLWSITIDTKREAQDLQWLLDNYGNLVRVMGVWKMNGLQAGQRLDEDGNVTGTPRYPINQTMLLKFMPTIKEHGITDPDSLDAPTVSESEPTTIADINLLSGQQPRNFD